MNMIIDRDSLVEYVAQKTDDSKNSFFVDLIVTGILLDDHPKYETDWSEFLGNLDLTYYIDAAKQTYHIAVMDRMQPIGKHSAIFDLHP